MNEKTVLLIVPESFFIRLKKDYEAKCRNRNITRAKSNTKHQRESEPNIDEYVLDVTESSSLSENHISQIRERLYDPEKERKIIEFTNKITELEKEISTIRSKYEELISYYSRVKRISEDLHRVTYNISILSSNVYVK